MTSCRCRLKQQGLLRRHGRLTGIRVMVEIRPREGSRRIAWRRPEEDAIILSTPALPSTEAVCYKVYF